MSSNIGILTTNQKGLLLAQVVEALYFAHSHIDYVYQMAQQLAAIPDTNPDFSLLEGAQGMGIEEGKGQATQDNLYELKTKLNAISVDNVMRLFQGTGYLE